MKHYRFRKVTPEIKRIMVKLRKINLSYAKIGEMFGLCASTIQYHLNEKERKRANKRALNYYYNLPKKQRKEKEKKRYAYKKQYLNERYNNDKEFRKRHIKNIQNSFERRRERWKKEDRCLVCGGKKIEKKWKSCEGCRKKQRGRKERKSL